MDWGPGASPVVYDGLVYFAQDDDLASFVVALDAKTGEQRWKTARPDMLAGYALPVLCTANGRTDLVVAGSGKLKGYDPKTGEEIWKDRVSGDYRSSPILAGEHLYFFSERGRGAIIKASRTFQQVPANEVPEMATTASPAVSKGALFVRGRTHLYKIQQP